MATLTDIDAAELDVMTTERRWHGRSPKPINIELAAAESRLLELLKGREIKSPSLDGLHVIQHIRSLVYAAGREQYEDDIHPNFCSDQTPFHRFLWLCCEVIMGFLANKEITITRLLKRLQIDHVLGSTGEHDTPVRLKNLIFCSIGWLSHLYLPIQTASN